MRAHAPSPARIARATPSLARAQATWIVGIEPWAGLGYRAQPLGRWLGRAARARGVWVARGARAGATVEGIIVVEMPFLLGGFIALLAVRPAAAGRGVGRALVAQARRQVFTVSRQAVVVRIRRQRQPSRAGVLPQARFFAGGTPARSHSRWKH